MTVVVALLLAVVRKVLPGLLAQGIKNAVSSAAKRIKAARGGARHPETTSNQEKNPG